MSETELPKYLTAEYVWYADATGTVICTLGDCVLKGLDSELNFTQTDVKLINHTKSVAAYSVPGLLTDVPLKTQQ